MKLKEYMEKKGIKAVTLAHHLGVSVATIFNWHSLKTKPHADNMEKISKFTNGKVKAEDFYG